MPRLFLPSGVNEGDAEMVIGPLKIRRVQNRKSTLKPLRLSPGDKALGLAIVAFCMIAAAFSAWLIINYRD
jgi:hypothetical protein